MTTPIGIVSGHHQDDIRHLRNAAVYLHLICLIPLYFRATITFDNYAYQKLLTILKEKQYYANLVANAQASDLKLTDEGKHRKPIIKL